MCAVSAVTDYYRQNIWPNPGQFDISWPAYEQYVAFKKMAIQIDVDQHQHDCAKPEIEAWEREVEEQARLWQESQ